MAWWPGKKLRHWTRDELVDEIERLEAQAVREVYAYIDPRPTLRRMDELKAELKRRT